MELFLSHYRKYRNTRSLICFLCLIGMLSYNHWILPSMAKKGHNNIDLAYKEIMGSNLYESEILKMVNSYTLKDLEYFNSVQDIKLSITTDEKISMRIIALSLISREIDNPYEKLRYLQKAIDLANEAVDLNPDSLLLHKTRYLLQTSIPYFFSNRKLIKEDILFLNKSYKGARQK